MSETNQGSASRARTEPHVAIISGLSGAGKTAASKLLEDVGYRVIDNLPAELLRHLAQLVARETAEYERVALVLDARSGNPALAYREAVHGPRQALGASPTGIFGNRRWHERPAVVERARRSTRRIRPG